MMEIAKDFFTTHPPKLTHSTPLSKQSKFKAKDLNVVSTLGYTPDGYLKTGNVSVDMDLSGYPDNGASTDELPDFFSWLLDEMGALPLPRKARVRVIPNPLKLLNVPL